MNPPTTIATSENQENQTQGSPSEFAPEADGKQIRDEKDQKYCQRVQQKNQGGKPQREALTPAE